jgi:hypothetical protein
MQDDLKQMRLFDTEDQAQYDRDDASNSSKFSNYIAYVDESGDHSIVSVDQQYPVFVLAFCVFHKRHYSEKVVPLVEKFKFKHFGHDSVVLHETEIRKEIAPFNIFSNRFDKNGFLDELTEIVEAINFVLISCVIDKAALKLRGSSPPDPYHIALGYCLEAFNDFLKEKGQTHALTHVVVERRGKKEDNELELAFRRICDGNNKLAEQLPFQIVFASKQVNSAGLQLADLVARPIGLSVHRPNQTNRSFEVLKRKFYCAGGRKNVGNGYENYGLKIFPLESERPR